MGGSIGLRPGKGAGAEIEYRHSDVEAPWGEFTANVVSARLDYAFSTALAADAVVQYNSLDERLSANVRLRLIHRPGSDLFVVFSEQRGVGFPDSSGDAWGSGTEAGSLWDLRSRGLVVKATYLVRL